MDRHAYDSLHLIGRLWLMVVMLLPLPLVAGNDRPEAGDKPVCAAVRGNGLRVFAHFGALARVHETFGTLHGMSGGSSGSLVSFLTDAIYSNPVVSQCGADICRDDEKAARLALLFKTLTTATEQAARTSEGQALSLPGRLVHAVEQQRLDALMLEKPELAVRHFQELLDSPPFKAAVNPEVWRMLDKAHDKPALVRDLLKGIRGSMVFTLDSPKVFVRPGVIANETFVNFFGRIGSLYAMDAPATDRARMAQFLDSCAVPGIGLPWSQVATLKAVGMTCGALFGEITTHHFSAKQDMSGIFVDRPVGNSLPMLISVSAMTGQSADLLRMAQEDYVAGIPLRWAPDFADWRVLYTGRRPDLNRLQKNPRSYDDLKTLRAEVAPDMSWREIMRRSGSEPGQQAAIPLPGVGFTAGGWVDGQPVRALKNMGCDKVVLLDAPPSLAYQQTVAHLLGASPSMIQNLFDTESITSSFALNIRDADAVWCTDWNQIDGADIQGLDALGWNAPVEVRGSWKSQRPYAKLTTTAHSTLCTPAPKP